MNFFVYLVAGLIAIAGALGLILAKQPVHQVLATVLNFLGLAVLYLSLSGEFMAVIQMIVYSGAVMILFLFVITLLTARKDPVEKETGARSPQAIAGWAIGGSIALMLATTAIVGRPAAAVAKIDDSFGTVKAFGHELLTVHVLPFELTAFVLMVAVIGVIILVGRQKA
ncbi:MAG TPA: NADH-quinone oxidoreductase subunit J [Symbiobacteriaceae bacterium]|jgi:NADH-quinone oxidoreductase subunit J